MGRKVTHLKPDTVLKNYWSDNEQFADLFNAVLFEGKQVILPDELEDEDTEESSVLEHREYMESVKAARDNIKVCKRSVPYNAAFVLLGMEHQEHVHYAMPLRIMGYDYNAYKKQYERNAKKYQCGKGLSEDEYLSRMKKTDQFMPVITITMYYGERPWDGAVSLGEMLKIPKEMTPFVNDYKMLLVEARKNNLILHNINNRDLFNLLEILLNRGQPLHETKHRAIEYAREHQVDKSVILTVAGAANCRIDYDALMRKGDVNMCTVFEELAKEHERKGKEEGREEGREKGREEGREEGRKEGKAAEIIEGGFEFGLSRENILERLQKKLNISLQKAQEYMQKYGKLLS